MSFIVLWVLTVFPIFHKMDDVSASRSKGKGVKLRPCQMMI